MLGLSLHIVEVAGEEGAVVEGALNWPSSTALFSNNTASRCQVPTRHVLTQF